MKDMLLIIGASGHGKVVADIALKLNIWKDIAFLDDNEAIIETMGLHVIGTSKDAFNYLEKADLIVAIGDNKTRQKILQELEEAGASIRTLIHPSAIIGGHVGIGIGTVVMAGAIINCDTIIGEGCIINTGAIIEHDNIIEDYVHISPGAMIAGTVKIGKSTWVGIGSKVCNNLSITSDCVIGAGAVVLNNIQDSGTYVGVPARRV